MNHATLITAVQARLAKASKPGAADPIAFEAARCLDAIDDHTATPRDFSADFIARQWVRVAELMA